MHPRPLRPESERGGLADSIRPGGDQDPQVLNLHIHIRLPLVGLLVSGQSAYQAHL